MRTIIAERLSPHAFAPFGTAVMANGSGRMVNQGRAVRFDCTPAFANETGHPLPALSLYRAMPLTLPWQVPMLERHPFSAQTFLAMTVPRFVAIVAPSDDQGEPDVMAARAFVGHSGEGVVYGRNVWHAPMVVLDGPGDMAVMMWEHGDPRDTEERPLAEPFVVAHHAQP